MRSDLPWSDRPGTIYLARHGRSTWNEQGRIAGQLDPPLSGLGRQQAANLATILSDVGLEAIYTSPLERARETAMPTAERCGLEPRVRDELKEIHFGGLQGRFRDDRDPEARRALEGWRASMASSRLAGGESLGDLQIRVSNLLVEIFTAAEHDTILIVGHRYTNRALLGTLLGRERTGWGALKPKSRQLIEIARGELPLVHTLSLDSDGLGRRRSRTL